MSDRARLTLTDTLYVLLAVAALAALYPVYHGLLGGVAGLSTGQQLLFSTVLPLGVLVILAVVYVEARGGLA